MAGGGDSELRGVGLKLRLMFDVSSFGNENDMLRDIRCVVRDAFQILRHKDGVDFL